MTAIIVEGQTELDRKMELLLECTLFLPLVLLCVFLSGLIYIIELRTKPELRNNTFREKLELN